MPSVAPATDRPIDWRQRLREARLPALADEDAWKALMAEADDPDATQDRIAFDLPLGLSFLVEANQSPRIGANLTGLHHALRMFGTERVKRRLKEWPAGRLDPAQPAHRLTLQSLASSRLACLFLSRWMRHTLVPDAEYRLWATALLGVARWKLPLVDERVALAVERRVAQGERRPRVEAELLGVAMEALTVEHLQDLGFADAPALANRARLDARHIGEAARCAREQALPLTPGDALQRRLRDPLVCAGLAYALALETQVDWHSPRCALLVRAAATALNRPVSGVLEDMHRAAIEASGEALYVRGLLAPAARLIRLPRPRLSNDPAPEAVATPAPPPAASAAPAAQPPARPARTASVATEYLARCRTHGFASVPEFLRASVDMLAALGLPRCALFLRMKNPERIANYLSQGLGDPARVRQISFPLPSPDCWNGCWPTRTGHSGFPPSR